MGNYRNRRPRFKYRRNRRYSKPKALNPSLFISSGEPVASEKSSNYSGKEFSDYNFSPQIKKNLQAKGFKSTTEVQEKVIDKILAGRNVVAISRTGSGKTGAFLIPMIEKIMKSKKERVLILAPTRELAKQISDEAFSIIKRTKIYVTLVIGGENIRKQISQLNKHPQIVVGTPGRLKDVYQRKAINLRSFNNIILDEVDRMLDMGFVDEIKMIYKLTADKKQALFFSATSDKRVTQIINELAPNCDHIRLSENKPTESVNQNVIGYQQKEQKIDKLSSLLATEEVKKSLVFVETKRYADKVGKVLYKMGHKNGVIHGDKRQNQRRKVLESFRRSDINVLIATNVAARGIDIDDISHVINLDTPTNYDDYIHRIGRTGRNGRIGFAYTFIHKS